MHQYRPTLRFGFGSTPPAVKWLLIANVAVFVLHYLLVPAVLQPAGVDPVVAANMVIHLFGFNPSLAVGHVWLWQFVTYMFLHGGFFHLIFNMLILWMLGRDLEKVWGAKAFLRYYFITGIGAALFQIPFWNTVAVGASGAIYGILVAFAMLYPDRRLYVYFFLPVKAKYLVIGLFVFEMWLGLTSTGSGVAHLAHVGGAAVGFLYLKRAWRIREFWAGLRWRLRRSRFKVVGRDRDDKAGPWVH